MPGIVCIQLLMDRILIVVSIHELSLKNPDSCSNNMQVMTWNGYEGRIGASSLNG